MPGSDDGTDQRGNLGRTCPACSVDSGRNCTQHFDVWAGLDANGLLEGAVGRTAATNLLRGQRVSLSAATDSSVVCSREAEPAIEDTLAFDRRPYRSTRNRESGPSSTSQSVRRQSRSCRRSTPAQSWRIPGGSLRKGRRE